MFPTFCSWAQVPSKLIAPASRNQAVAPCKQKSSPCSPPNPINPEFLTSMRSINHKSRSWGSKCGKKKGGGKRKIEVR